MLDKKQKKEVENLKYFPIDGIEGFTDDLRDLDKEVEDLMNELSNDITVSDVFQILSMEQKNIMYKIYLANSSNVIF